jgi:hypothetical protein
MHHYAIIRTAFPCSRCEPLDRVARFIQDNLVFRPEIARCSIIDEHTFLVSFSVNNELMGFDDVCYEQRGTAILVGGFPTFEQFPELLALARVNPAAAFSDVMTRNQVDVAYAKIGGNYSVLHAGLDRIVAFSCFAGYDSQFFGYSDGIFVVGSKPSLVAHLLHSDGLVHNKYAASWILSTTMILGEQTLFEGVRRVPNGCALVFEEGVARVDRLRPLFFLAREPGISDADLKKAAEGLAERYAYYLGSKAPKCAHITGGKDSRTNLAVIDAVGGLDKIEYYQTFGSDQNGDVIVGRLVAKCLNIKNHSVIAGDKKPAWTKNELAARIDKFPYSAWKYDGYLTPWDGVSQPATKRVKQVTFTGGAGEIYRQKNIVIDPRNQPFGISLKRFQDWYYKFNSMGLLTREVEYRQRHDLQRTLEELADRGVRNIQPVLYMEQRLANWGWAHFRNTASASIAGLVDLQMERTMQTSIDKGDDVHFGIIQTSSPKLLDIPLLNEWWTGPTATRASAMGLEKSVLKVPVAVNFPWQFQAAAQHLKSLVGFIIDGWQHVEEIVDKSSLEALLTKPELVQKSPAIKSLFGLHSIVSLFSGEVSRARDFDVEGYQIRCRGNRAKDLARALLKIYQEADMSLDMHPVSPSVRKVPTPSPPPLGYGARIGAQDA